MNRVACLQAKEVVYRKPPPKQRFKEILQSRQRSVNFLQDIICKFTKLGDSIPDAYGRKNAPCQASLLLKQHRELWERERDQNCVVEAVPSLVEMFVRVHLKKDSYLTAREDYLSACKTLVDALDINAAMKRADVWAVPKMFTAEQTFLKLIMHFMSMYYKD